MVYGEPGSTYWPVLWGPAFALLGLGIEALTGPVHLLGWLLAAVVLAALTLVWVRARRTVCSVELTADTLRQGRESLPVSRIKEVAEVEDPLGARVLGGGFLPPKSTTGLPVRLDDDSLVLAWAKDDDALRDALRGLLDA